MSETGSMGEADQTEGGEMDGEVCRSDVAEVSKVVCLMEEAGIGLRSVANSERLVI